MADYVMQDYHNAIVSTRNTDKQRRHLHHTESVNVCTVLILKSF